MKKKKDEYLPKSIELQAKAICDSLDVKLIETTKEHPNAHQIEVYWGKKPQDFLYIDRKRGFKANELQIVIHPKLNKKCSETIRELAGINSPKGTELGKLILSSQYKGFQNYVSGNQHQGAAWRLQISGNLESLHRFISTLLSVDKEIVEFPDTYTDTGPDIEYVEGAKYDVTLSKYERSNSARKACIAHYGCKCLCCKFDFESTFGEIGIGFIHVHHVVSLEEIGKSYKVNPITDLIPLCPNCHAMVHKIKPPGSLFKLQRLLEK